MKVNLRESLVIFLDLNSSIGVGGWEVSKSSLCEYSNYDKNIRLF